MNKSSIRGLIILALLVGILQVSVAGATSCNPAGAEFRVLGVIWGNATSKISAGPGQMDVPLTVTLQSYGTNCNLVAVEGKLQISGGYSNFNGSLSYPKYFTQSVSPDSIFNMTFHLNIANNIVTGPNTISNYFLYMYYNYSNNTDRESQGLSVAIPMHGSPHLTFTTKNPEVSTGLDSILINVTNSGSGPAYNITTTVSTGSGVSVIGTTDKEVGTLLPGESKTLSVLVYSESSGGSVSLGFDSSYISPYGYNTTLKSSIGLYMESQQTAPITYTKSPLEINVSTDILISQQISNITFIFSNNGNTILRNVSAQTFVTGSHSGIEFLDNNPIRINSIFPHSSVSVTRNIYENGSQIFPINVSATFFNGSSLEAVSNSFTMISGGTINMIPSSMSVTPTTVAPGDIFSLSFIITDTGTTGVTDANASVLPTAEFRPYGTSATDFIGSISTESPTSISLTMIANSSLKGGKYVIPVVLSYLGNFRQRMNTTVNVTVNVTSTSSSGTSYTSGSRTSTGATATSRGKSTGLYIFVVTFVVVIVVIFGFSKLRRSSKGTNTKQK